MEVDLDGARKHAEQAARTMINRSMAFIIPGQRGTLASWVGTGVLFVSPAGNPMILTAAHNLDDVEQSGLRVGFQGLWTAQSCLDRFVRHPDSKVDVAVIIPVPSLRDQICLQATGYSSMAESFEIHADDNLYVCGFPSAYVQTQPKKQAFNSLTYGCFASDPLFDPMGRMRLEWTEGIWAGKNEAEAMPNPGGMSGGAIWRFRAVGKEQVWSTRDAARLVGVQSAWDTKQILFVEPTARWKPWLDEIVAELDA